MPDITGGRLELLWSLWNRKSLLEMAFLVISLSYICDRDQTYGPLYKFTTYNSAAQLPLCKHCTSRLSTTNSPSRNDTQESKESAPTLSVYRLTLGHRSGHGVPIYHYGEWTLFLYAPSCIRFYVFADSCTHYHTVSILRNIILQYLFRNRPVRYPLVAQSEKNLNRYLTNSAKPI